MPFPATPLGHFTGHTNATQRMTHMVDHEYPRGSSIAASRCPAFAWAPSAFSAKNRQFPIDAAGGG